MSGRSTPVFAYYYIWFDPSSWNRAKTDLPTLGKYSSDDPNVMRQQIVWAKQAGIDGFIVSWKHTPTLDRRLAQLIDIAQRENFSLEMIYQGLDFDRKPLPVLRVAGDFQFFAKTFAARTPFHRFTKPLVIWSGTWMYSAADVERVTRPVRHTVMVLASEKNVDGYERLAGSVDGDAYYWSSVNPDTNTGYLEKLVDLSNAIHGRGGLWIAPAAAGFDARQIGGKTIVDRQDGAVLQHELTTANASAPGCDRRDQLERVQRELPDRTESEVRLPISAGSGVDARTSTVVSGRRRCRRLHRLELSGGQRLRDRIDRGTDRRGVVVARRRSRLPSQPATAGTPGTTPRSPPDGAAHFATSHGSA